MKKIFYYLLITLFVALLTNCGGSNNETSNENIDDQIQEETEQALEDISEAMGGAPGSESVLSQADIDRFIETFEDMSKDLDDLDENFDADYNDVGESLKAVFEAPEVVEIVEKYGWDKTFGHKFMAIMMGFTYAGLQEMAKTLPEEQKNVVTGQWEQYKNMVHQDDLDLIGDNYEDLKVFFERANLQ